MVMQVERRQTREAGAVHIVERVTDGGAWVCSCTHSIRGGSRFLLEQRWREHVAQHGVAIGLPITNDGERHSSER